MLVNRYGAQLCPARLRDVEGTRVAFLGEEIVLERKVSGFSPGSPGPLWYLVEAAGQSCISWKWPSTKSRVASQVGTYLAPCWVANTMFNEASLPLRITPVQIH